LYQRTATQVGAVAKAYCDDVNDIVISGSCSGSALWAYVGAVGATDSAAKAAWECDASNSGATFSAMVICLGVQ
jgi:hypothetical protein